MKSSLLLSATLALLLPAMPVIPVHAQEDHGGVDEHVANTRAARKAAEAKKHGATNQAPLYPNATRQSPEQSGDKATAKEMEALFKLQDGSGNEDQIISRADAILANPKANAFDKSSAAYLAGAAWQGKETSGYANAIKYYKLAVDNNGLHNNNHYRAMLQLAQMMEGDDRHAEALAMIDKFLDETKSDDPSAWSIKTQILVSLDRPKDAAVGLEKLLAAKPNDKKTMMNLASVYMQSDQDAKAGQMFDKMRAAGLLTESKDYETGFRLLANIDGREKDAMSLIDEGLAKGILQPSYEMYAFQGRTYFQADDTAKALAAWSKGAPMSKDGEMYLNVGKLQLDGDHYAEAKAAALSAQSKGVKRQGDVYQVIARAEHGMHNEAASKAALQQAAKFPETKKWAEAALRQGLGD
jgi:tetratricopeptide (TPR) repeat protein